MVNKIIGMVNSFFKKKNDQKKMITIGIDIDEVLRKKWEQFDKYYALEFNDISEPKYTLNFFKDYVWEGVEEVNNILKDDLLEINPIDYHLGENDGRSDAELFLTNKETTYLTPEEVFNRFLYEDYLLEIFGNAKSSYLNVDLDVNMLITKFKDCEFIFFSKENDISIQPTFFFLSKNKFKVRNVRFFRDYSEINGLFDVIITTDPELIKLCKKENVTCVSIVKPYNNKLSGVFLSVNEIKDLINNKKFEKKINKYVKHKNNG